MFNLIIKYFFVYTLMLFSFALFFSVIGYYTFIFDWGDNLICSLINVFILLMLSCVSIAIYYLAEKIKLIV